MLRAQGLSLSALTKKIFIIALPVIIQTMTEYVMIFTSTAFIGRYRIDGLSAINNTLQPYFMFLSFFFALSQGATILIAQSLGANDKNSAEKYAEAAFFYNQLISFGYFVFWFFAGEYVLYLVGARGEILQLGKQYLQIISFLFLGIGAFLSASSVFQGIGNTLPIMIASIIKTSLNIFLTWSLVFGRLGFPELGIRGAALAIVASEFVGNSLLVFLCFRLKEFKITLKGILKPAFSFYKKIFSVGLPAGLDYGLWSLGQVIILVFLNRLDPLASGLFAILNILISLSLNIYTGISVAALNLVGKATGAKHHHEAKRACNTSVVYSLLVCCLVAGVFIFLPHQVLSIFTTDQSVINRLLPMMLLLTLIIFPKAANIVVGNSIRGTGDTRWMMMTQFFGTFIIIGMAYLAMFQLHLGIAGLLWACFIDETWRAIVNYSRFYWVQRNHQVQAKRIETA